MSARDDYPVVFPASSYAGAIVGRMHDEIDRLRAALDAKCPGPHMVPVPPEDPELDW